MSILGEMIALLFGC